jgi:hypothetical protein
MNADGKTCDRSGVRARITQWVAAVFGASSGESASIRLIRGHHFRFQVYRSDAFLRTRSGVDGAVRAPAPRSAGGPARRTPGSAPINGHDTLEEEEGEEKEEED